MNDSTALEVIEAQTSDLPVKADAKPMTPQQARVSEVSDALAPAYQKASTLELTDEEIAALTAPFPDECVEIRPHDGLIYIPHILISDRLNKIFKPGKWSLICRRHWMENDVMYGEYVLLVRGCFVGESVGGHAYQVNNPKVNYSDTLESTAAEALRRICGKRLSCGSQVWHPEYAREWCAKHATKVGGKWERRFTDPQGRTESQPQSQQPRPRRETGMSNEEQQKAQAVGDLEGKLAGIGMRPQDLVDYGKKQGWDAGETLAQFPLPRLHWIVQNFRGITPDLKQFTNGDQIPGAEVEPHDPARLAQGVCPQCDQGSLSKSGEHYVCTDESCGWTNKPDAPPPEFKIQTDNAPWRSFPFPWGKHAGTKLGDMEKKTLYGFWANYKVETEWNGKPKKAETIAKEQKLREMLDAAGVHYQFTKKEDARRAPAPAPQTDPDDVPF